jgi:hypothetical protein
MKTPSVADECPVREGTANLQLGVETVGGTLYLTNRRLIFETQVLNIQTGATIIPLNTITGVRKCWTKFLNLIPLLPNSIAVSTRDGKEYRFVAFGRQDWIAAIEGALGALTGAPTTDRNLSGERLFLITNFDRFLIC